MIPGLVFEFWIQGFVSVFSVPCDYPSSFVYITWRVVFVNRNRLVDTSNWFQAEFSILHRVICKCLQCLFEGSFLLFVLITWRVIVAIVSCLIFVTVTRFVRSFVREFLFCFVSFVVEIFLFVLNRNFICKCDRIDMTHPTVFRFIFAFCVGWLACCFSDFNASRCQDILVIFGQILQGSLLVFISVTWRDIVRSEFVWHVESLPALPLSFVSFRC
jgi:hypothetical protein